MNAQDIVEYEQQVSKYIQDVKLQDFFENLIRMLVLNKPKDPLNFLVELLEHRVIQRLILVHGIVAPKRNEIVQAIGNAFNYKIISIEEILQDLIGQNQFRDSGWLDDNRINQAVYENLKKIEKHHRGIILSGYPSNLQQCLFLQQKGIIPERFFQLHQDQESCKQYYQTLYEHSLREQNIVFTKDQLSSYVQNAIDRDKINMKELDLSYGNQIDQFDLQQRSKEEIIDNLKQILKIRDRKQPPLRFPRVIIIRPPKLKERALHLTEIFGKRYGLKSIVCFEGLEEQIINQTEIGKYIDHSIKSGIQLPDEIVQSIIYTKVQSTQARTKGWIIEGFPKNKTQLNALNTYKFYPNLILILHEDEESLLNKIKSLKYDPLTGKKYETVPQGDKNILNRIQTYKITNEQKQIQELQNYNIFIREIEKQYGDRVQMFKLEKDTIENIIRITDVFLNNPKIYN